MDNEKTISVDGKFTIKIGDTEMAVTREEAERLYSELYKALGKFDVYYQFGYPTKPGYHYYIGDEYSTCHSTCDSNRMHIVINKASY